MRILYGVVGEGMGHAIRSRVIIDHLIHHEGHDVQVVVSGRAYEVLREWFPDVQRIWGLEMTYRDSEFKVWRSVLDNLRKGVFGGGFDDNVAQFFATMLEFDPDCVISDFESWSYFYGMALGLPILCVDNIQMVARCRHPKALLDLHRADYELSKNFVKGKLARSTHFYITTFFYPDVRKPRTTQVPSVLRDEILGAATSTGDHVLVYQTTTSCQDLPDVLAAIDAPFRVYGYRRDLDAPVVEGNVTWCPFSEPGFMADLASCRAVIASAGFTLMSEAVYLHKPMLAVPVVGQFEQVMNAFYLEQEGFGYGNDVIDGHTVRHFLERTDDYAEALQRYRQDDGNGVLFGLLDERLDRIAAGVDRLEP